MDAEAVNPLFNKDAEEALIGAALIDPSVIYRVEIAPEAFYVKRLGMVWSAMLKIHRAGMTPDFVTIPEQLGRDGTLQQTGGFALLADLSNLAISSFQAEDYARIITDYARRRSTLLAASELAKAAYDTKSPIEEKVTSIFEKISRSNVGHGAVHWGDALSELYDDVSARMERTDEQREVWGIPTGFVDFDKMTGGLQAGEVLYIGGAPGAGKSILSMQMGLNMAKDGHPGVIYSLEMRALQITRRAVSYLSGVETWKLKSGKMESDDLTKFTQTIDQSANWPLYLCDDPTLTTSVLRADLLRLKSRHNIEWFVLDYLFLMADGEGRMDDNQRTALLSRRIKAIALELGLAGITVNSVTKDAMGDDARPDQRNIRGSGQVVHDADVIGFLTEYIPEGSLSRSPADKNKRTFSFAKGRELENARAKFHLIKFEKIPAFGNAVLDTVDLNNDRILTGRNGNGNGRH